MLQTRRCIFDWATATAVLLTHTHTRTQNPNNNSNTNNCSPLSYNTRPPLSAGARLSAKVQGQHCIRTCSQPPTSPYQLPGELHCCHTDPCGQSTRTEPRGDRRSNVTTHSASCLVAHAFTHTAPNGLFFLGRTSQPASQSTPALKGGWMSGSGGKKQAEQQLSEHEEARELHMFFTSGCIILILRQNA